MNTINFGTKKLGFGCMRLPMINNTAGEEGDVDIPQVCDMVDFFLEQGFCYFDTAHGYISGKSELAVKECLTKRHPRESYLLTDKLSPNYFDKEEDILPVIYDELEACGVSYFDFLLMHALNATSYEEKYKKYNAFEIAKQLKEEGKIRHIGISFHDTAEVLEKILTEQPAIEVVQIQFNYADLTDLHIQSKAVYEVCRKFNKPVLVMEPVKGGRLADLPAEGKQILDDLKGGSNASYAIRFAASHEGVAMVLSGMSTMAQMNDNISFMKEFKPLTDTEYEAIHKVQTVLKKQAAIPCTSCRYCVEGCPQGILIPDLFTCYNTKKAHEGWDSKSYYSEHTANGHGKASECVQCRQCEEVCPQHLNVPELLEQVAKTFE